MSRVRAWGFLIVWVLGLTGAERAFGLGDEVVVTKTRLTGREAPDAVSALEDRYVSWKCSRCGRFSMDGVNTCPYCGTPKKG